MEIDSGFEGTAIHSTTEQSNSTFHDFSSPVAYATAVLAAAEEERSSIIRAVLAATKEQRSSTPRGKLRHNREILRWPESNHRQLLTTNSAPSSTEVCTSLHHCNIPSLVFILSLRCVLS
uniref:T32E20.8 n=1 Tax=Arabidopsis thaliana TaxID=3702 RepID=Q9LPB2_ARATH|nr:T32E20.8 [Arabidopsis thaliana]